ncbi:MAG: hypothetical protein ABIB71_01005 [Candidatus Woesearchaeota archaeon]
MGEKEEGERELDEREEILQGNFEEYYNQGIESLKREKYNSAATLFFKAMAALCDLFILKKEGFVPKSHSERFRVLEKKYPEIYEIVDTDFSFYQDSYTKKIDKETAELLKDDIGRIKEKAEI